MAAKRWQIRDLTGELPPGSSLSLPRKGTVAVGVPLRGVSVGDLQDELDSLYPRRFVVALVEVEA